METLLKDQVAVDITEKNTSGRILKTNKGTSRFVTVLRPEYVWCGMAVPGSDRVTGGGGGGHDWG